MVEFSGSELSDTGCPRPGVDGHSRSVDGNRLEDARPVINVIGVGPNHRSTNDSMVCGPRYFAGQVIIIIIIGIRPCPIENDESASIAPAM
jgi:hypothetical protein